MPVIINDLEVVIESPTPPGQQPGSSGESQSQSSPIELMPYDISVLQRQQRNRAERIKAH